ncbi:MAG: glycosyl hydrolase [Bacteroidota bacterium]
MQTKLLAGTSKGLIILHKENHSWKINEVYFLGLPVSFVYVDERINSWWVGISHRHWGEKLHFSADEGKSWHEAGIPGFKNYFYRPGKPASLRKIWTMQHAGADKHGCLWLGTEPGGLFFSDDNGKSWQLVESLWNHPSRLDDKQWFGAGKDFPFIHSIITDPRNSEHVYIGISCAGVFKTLDGGKNWLAINKGLIAAYLPNPNAEVGHDPHRMLLCPANPDVIWQQNHCGIFRTIDGGESWDDVSGANGFPKYGFALAIDELDPKKAWVIPAQSDEQRIPVDLSITVCKTIDGGKSWTPGNEGLPVSNTFDLVLRHAFVKSGKTLAFGSNNGNLYVSDNYGESWKTISQNLSTVNCLAFS